MLAFFLLFTALPSFAQTECAFSPNTLVRGYITQPRMRLNCDFIKEADKVIRESAELAQVSPKVFLAISGEGSDAAFDMGTILEVAQQFVLYNDYGQAYGRPSVDNFAVVAHEYGHAIFAQILMDTSPEYRPIFTFLRANSEERFRLNRALLSLPKSPELVKQLELNNQQRINFLGAPKNAKLYEACVIYSELFGDLIAVFQSGRKEAITSALFNPRLSPQARNLAFARSFDDSSDFKIHPYNESEDHAYFYKVRRYIGGKLWPRNPAEAQLKLRKITKAILDDMAAPRKGTPAEQNDSLIARLEK